MKQRLSLLLVLLITLCLFSLLLSSCGKEPASAYDIAVKNGFVGTEEEWLASLKGQDLNIYDIYTKAVEEGYEGDFLSFLTTHLHLDASAVADAIIHYEAKDISKTVAYPLLASVSIQCSSSGLSGDSPKPSAGSGVIYSLDKHAGDAFIITNQHVVAYTDNSSVRRVHQNLSVFLWGDELTSSNLISATYVGGSETYDIAVLKITGSTHLKNSAAMPISVFNSDKVVMGQTAIAIGNAAGQGISVTTGAVSMDSKLVTLSGDREQRLMQIETPINEGNSGGGLFDRDGTLIGIVSSKVDSSGVENMGYAIPSNIAIGVADNLISAYQQAGENASVTLTVADLGITFETGNTWAEYDSEAGVARICEEVTIDSVALFSPAKNAGLRKGDVIVKMTVDGHEIEISRSFSLLDGCLTCRTGSSVTIEYLRDDVTHTATLTLPSTCFVLIP